MYVLQSGRPVARPLDGHADAARRRPRLPGPAGRALATQRATMILICCVLVLVLLC